MRKLLAPGVERRNQSIQLQFSVTRLAPGPNRIKVSYPVERFNRAETERAVALRSQLLAAAERPGTDDGLLLEHLSEDWIARLGVRVASDDSLQVAIDREMASYDDARPNTKKTAQRECNAILATFHGERPISSFANAHTELEHWLQTMAGGERWREKVGTRLKKILETARRDGVITRHPLESRSWFADMSPSTASYSAELRELVGEADDDDGEVWPFSADEQAAIIGGKSTNPDMTAMIQVGFATGLRCGELFALTVEDIDLDARMINIRRQYTAGTIGKPKTNDGNRIVPILDEVVFVLRHQVNKYKKAKPVMTPIGEREVPMRFLFRNLAGNPYNGNDGFRKWWKNHLKVAEVEYRSPYQMRHTFATDALEVRGWNLNDVARVMGHKDPDVTRRRYIKPTTEHDELRTKRLIEHGKAQKVG